VDIQPIGNSKPLGRIPRVYKWDTSNIVPDDGFRELGTINQNDFLNPDVHRMEERPTKKMIQNIGENPLVEREGGPKTGFGSVLPHHDASHGQTFFETSNQHFYGNPPAPTKEGKEEEFRKTQTNHAGGDKWAQTESVKKISGLTGEVYN